MKAAILYEAGSPLVIDTMDMADPLDDEVRIRVVASGLCHSDFARMVGQRPVAMPVVLGHEVSGIVEAIGTEVVGFKPGDAVVVGVPACGHCSQCSAGAPQRCAARPARKGPPRLTCRGRPVAQFLEIGGFMETVLVDQRGVARLPDDMPVDLAALLGCAVISGFGAVTHCARVQPGQSVAVIGCGGVGLNIVQAARIAGATRIIAIDVSAEKRDLALQLGATDALAAGADIADSISDMTDGGVDHAFEAVGKPDTIGQGIAMLRKGGTATLVGIPPAQSRIALDIDLMFRNELRLLTTISGSMPLQTAIGQLGRHCRSGALRLAPLVASRIALDQINAGFQALHAGSPGRTLVTFDGILPYRQ